MEKDKEKYEQLVSITANNALQYTKDLHALNSFARFSGRPLRISEKLAMSIHTYSRAQTLMRAD